MLLLEVLAGWVVTIVATLLFLAGGARGQRPLAELEGDRP